MILVIALAVATVQPPPPPPAIEVYRTPEQAAINFNPAPTLVGAVPIEADRGHHPKRHRAMGFAVGAIVTVAVGLIVREAFR